MAGSTLLVAFHVENLDSLPVLATSLPPPLSNLCSKPTEREKKLAHAVLSDQSDIGKAACELVQEYTNKIESVKEEMKKAASEYETLQSSYAEVRKKYHLATNANAQLRCENLRLKKELAAIKEKWEKAKEDAKGVTLSS